MTQNFQMANSGSELKSLKLEFFSLAFGMSRPREKTSTTNTSKVSKSAWHHGTYLATWETEAEGLRVQGQSRQFKETLSQNKILKGAGGGGTGGVAQVEGPLLSKHEALS